MKTNKIYKIKVIGTYVIIAALLIFFAINIIIGYSVYNDLYNDYAEVFMEVTQNIAESDKYDLYTSDVYTHTQMNNILEEFGFHNQSNISKVTELSKILSEINKKVTIGGGKKSSYKKLVNAQSCLESIKFLSEKYLKTNNNYNLKEDSETLSNDCTQIMIMRDTISEK